MIIALILMGVCAGCFLLGAFLGGESLSDVMLCGIAGVLIAGFTIVIKHLEAIDALLNKNNREDKTDNEDIEK